MLAIVVPYRDRASQFRTMFPALTRYLVERASQDFRIYVIEQAPGRPFNRGLIRNVGFALARAAEAPDQVCFHDVDYVPVEADFSPVDGPTRLIWHGLRNVEEYDRFFGGVIAMPSADFERINGYGNVYWEWGCEDVELRLRCTVAGLPIRYRDGRFRALLHRQEGVQRDGSLTDAAQRMEDLFERRLPGLRDGSVQASDGLSTIAFREIERQRIGMRELPDAPQAWRILVEV